MAEEQRKAEPMDPRLKQAIREYWESHPEERDYWFDQVIPQMGTEREQHDE